MKMLKKLSILIFLFYSLNSFSQTFIGLNQSLDFNAYRFYHSDQRKEPKTRFSIGYTSGILLEQKFNKILGINAGFGYSKKKYFPDRVFSFDELKEVRLTVIEIPVNIRTSLAKWIKSEKWEYYFMVGLTYQIEKKEEGIYKNNDENPNFPIFFRNEFLIPTASIGVQYPLKEKLFLSGELNFRGGKCHCEYLNPKFDKIGLVFSLKRIFF